MRLWGAVLGVLLALLGARGAEADLGGRTADETREPAGAEGPTLEGALPEDMVPASGRVPEPPRAFDTYDGGWIRFAFAPAARSRVQPLIAQADATREHFQKLLGHAVLDGVTVYVAQDADEMATLAPPGHPYPRYASGVAYPYLDLVLLTLHPKQHNPAYDLEEVFKHELAHLALKDAVAGKHVPRWLNEGFAVHFSGESSLARMKTLWTAALARTLLPLSELDVRFPDDEVETPIAYAQSADVVRHMLRTHDRERFMATLRRVRGGQPFPAALADAYGLDVPALEEEWLAEVAKRYSFWPVLLSSVVWVGAIGLFVVGYYRRRRQQRVTLDRWAVEEAAEERARVERERAPSRGAIVPAAAPRMHIVIAPRESTPPSVMPEARRSSEFEVPKIEHEGSWHTLH